MKNIQGEALSTPMFKSMPTKNSSIDSRPHYRSDAFSTAYTKTFENDRIIMRGGGGGGGWGGVESNKVHCGRCANGELTSSLGRNS